MLLTYAFNNGQIPCLSTVYDLGKVLQFLNLYEYIPDRYDQQAIVCWIREYRRGSDISTIEKLAAVLRRPCYYQVRISFFSRNKIKTIQDLRTANIPTISFAESMNFDSDVYTLYFMSSGIPDNDPVPMVTRSGVNDVIDGVGRLFRELTDSYKGYYLRCSSEDYADSTDSGNDSNTEWPPRAAMRSVEEEADSDTENAECDSDMAPPLFNFTKKFIPENIGLASAEFMKQAQELAAEIFADYQEEPVPVEKWMAKSDDAEVLIVPGKGILLYHTREHEFRCRDPEHLECRQAPPEQSCIATSTHIWLCGVKKPYRKQGVFRNLLKMMLNDKRCKDVISVHLNRKKFPEMYAAIFNLGFFLQGAVIGKNLERFEIPTSQLRKRLNMRT